MQVPPFESVAKVISDYIYNTANHNTTNYHEPETLRKEFDFSLAGQNAGGDPLQLIQQILDLSVNTQHHMFWNQLYAGPSKRNIIGEWLTSVLNTSMATYEIAPLFTLMEEEIFALVAGRLTWDTYEGFMVPGGSMANLYGMHLARHHYHTSNKQLGLQGRQYVIFTSDQGHYSIDKNAALMGIGTDHVIAVRSNDRGHMDVADLEKKIQASLAQGHIPLMINATFGTTVYGVLDPIGTIADIAEKYRIWLHVDGALGGSLLVSDHYRGHMHAFDRIDSLARNPHKMLGASQQASIFITRHASTARTCNTIHADYLFGQEKGYDRSLDTGDMYLQCGRRPDVLKLRLQRKMEGLDHVGRYVDDAFSRAKVLTDLIRESEHLLLVTEPETTNVCFWLLPPDMDPRTTTVDDIMSRYDDIHTLAIRTKEAMLSEGRMMCSYMTNKGLPNFWRMITHNIHSTDDDMRFVVEHIQELGEKVFY